jgi:hypothetical protein
LFLPAQSRNLDFDFADCCAQRLRLAADCPARDRQQFITDFRADARNLILFYRPVDQVKRSQVIHGWPLTNTLRIDLQFFTNAGLVRFRQ